MNKIKNAPQVKVKNTFPLTNSWTKIYGFGKGWGMTRVNVLATLEEAAAFFWHFESRAHADVTGDTERSIVETRGDFFKVVQRRQKLGSKHGGIHHEREFFNEMSLHKINEDTIVILMEPMHDLAVSRIRRKQRHEAEIAKERVAARFTRKGEKTTKIEYVTELELGIFVSKLATRFCLERHLDEATEIERFFVFQADLEHMTEKIGEALGHDMVWDGGRLGGHHSRNERTKHVEEVITKSKALSAIRVKYPWIVILMQRATEGALAANYSISTKLECLGEEEARIIGNNLMPALKSRKVVNAGIDLWMGQNRAINELLDEFPWMRALFQALGQGVVKTAPWGMMWRVTVGAALSTIDLVTDIYITYMFWKERGEKGIFFRCSMMMLIVSVMLMVSITILQHHKRGLKRVSIEVFPVILGLKPAVDAFRVASCAKIEEGQIFEPLVEMAYIKGVEMFAEAIPGVIIQLAAILSTDGSDGSRVSKAAILSLASSALTTGFISATLSYDMDTDPRRRISNPEFYGYVPNNATRRTVVFFSMLLLCSVMLCIRALTLVLLGLASVTGALLYIFFDYGLHLLFKIACGDFFYWLPIKGYWEYIVSALVRALTKVISDFTSCGECHY